MTSLIPIQQIKKDEDKFMNEIIESKGSNLPEKIEDIINVFEFTDFKAKAWKILVNKMDKLEEQSDLYQSALKSGQQWGISALYCQKRMGEITSKMPTAEPNVSAAKRPETGKIETLKKNGIDRNIYSDCEKFAEHSDILERVIENAKRKGEIPTKTAVLNTIRAERWKGLDEEAKAKRDKRTANEKTQAVKDYYDSIKGFEHSIDSAIISAEYGDFSSEGKNFMSKKHDRLRDKLNKLEELIK